jgi:hypothetical protein
MKSIKNIILLTLLSGLLFSFSNCGGTQDPLEIQFQSTPPFTVAEASFQKWVAGVQEGGSGTNVYINITNVSEGVELRDLYFRNEQAALNTSPNIRSQYVARFKKEGRSVIMDIDPEKEAKNTPPEKIQFQLNNTEAVVSYSYQGKTAYFKISQLEEKEMLAYPSSNPNDEN